MAIRFVETSPEDIESPRVERVSRRPEADLRPGDISAGELAVRLPLAKPEPKPRGRKKPLR